MQLSRQLGAPYNLAYMLLVGPCSLAVFRADWEWLRSVAGEVKEIAHDQGFPLIEAQADVVMALSLGFVERDPSAVERFTEAMARAAPGGNAAASPLFLGLLADLQLIAGRAADALGAVETALQLVQQGGQHFRDAELYRLKGECFLELEGHTDDEAEQLFRRAIEIARSQQAKSLELRAAMSLARWWQRQGQRTEPHALLAPVYDWFTEGFDTQDLKDAKALLDEL